jgi:ribosome-binding ATPase YchF (GTP1/OBG family)
MKIGIVGYQGAGKSTLFHWLTGIAPDLSLAHSTQMATAMVVDDRVSPLCEIYQPKKITQAMINIVDTPGLSRSHEGSANKLAMIREAGCLVVVIAAFSGASVQDDLQSFEEDLLIADLEIVAGRVEKLRDSVKKPRPNRDKELAELESLEPVLAQLETGKALRELELTDPQIRATKSFQLLTDKPRFVIINVSDDESESEKHLANLSDDTPAIAFSISLQMDLKQMEDAERAEFCQDMGVTSYDRDELLRKLMDASGQMLFFTAGDKEVRTWLIKKGATAEDAAAGIHTDLARGFVRAETMTCTDLFRLGSEREIKAQNLMRKEQREYVVQDGDILHILSST